MSNEKWKQNIEKALSFGIHISSYALTVEPKTAMSKMIQTGKMEAKTTWLKNILFLLDTLESNGFIHYELSNFGKQNYFKNNSAYWLEKIYGYWTFGARL
jgi:oxygen-independent coproporphyrinogen-3 oxidase